MKMTSLLTLGVAAGVLMAQGKARAEQSDPPASSSSSSQTSQDIRASKLIGADLTSSQGEDLGAIRDIVVNPQTGKIDFAIVGVDLGGGEQALAPVPWQAVQLHSEKSFVASIDKNKLKSGPRLTQQQWEQLAQPDYVVQIYRFYGIEPPAAGGTEQGAGGSSSGSGGENPSSQNR